MPSRAKDKANKKQPGAAKPGNGAAPIPNADEGELYAQVIRVLGSCKFTVRCVDGFNRMMSMMNGAKRRTDCWCRVGDYVVVQRLLYQTEDSRVIFRGKLTPADVKQARKEQVGGIPESWDDSGLGEGTDGFQFIPDDPEDAAGAPGPAGQEAAEEEDQVDMADL